MDLLFQKYASPFEFLDSLIQSDQLVDYIDFFITKENEEMEEKKSWEFFLHKIHEGTYQDFLKNIEDSKKYKMTEKEALGVVMSSNNILKGFRPEKE